MKALSTKRRAYAGLMRALMLFSVLLTGALVLFLIGYVLWKGIPNITWELLSTKPSYLRNQIGILPDILNTVYIVIGKIRHRYIVTVQERKSAVIILKIYRLAHTGRILIYKTEHASVTAATLFIHQKRRKFKSDVIVFRLFQRNVKKFSTSVNFERNKLFGYPKTVIENIAYLMSVYGYENIIRGDPSAVGNRTGDYIFYLYRGTHLRHTSAENLNYKIRTRPAGRNRRLRGARRNLVVSPLQTKIGRSCNARARFRFI